MAKIKTKVAAVDLEKAPAVEETPVPDEVVVVDPEPEPVVTEEPVAVPEVVPEVAPEVAPEVSTTEPEPPVAAEVPVPEASSLVALVIESLRGQGYLPSGSDVTQIGPVVLGDLAARGHIAAAEEVEPVEPPLLGDPNAPYLTVDHAEAITGWSSPVPGTGFGVGAGFV